MNRLRRCLKGIFVSAFYLIAGLMLMFFPKIAKILSIPFVNTDEVINQQWNFWFGLVLSVFSLGLIIYHIIHSKRVCIIKVDGMNGKRIKSETIKTLATKEHVFYNVNINGEANQRNIYKAYSEMRALFNAYEEKGLCDEYFFYGFNYTPFLFMLGQLYSDNRNYRFYHLKQTNDSEKLVKLSRLFAKKDGNKLNVSALNSNNNNKVLVIRVGTTVPAEKMDISQFGNVDTLDISSQINGTEVINSTKRLFEWCNCIVNEIRKIESGKYSTINLLLATSAEMAFLLGKRLSKNSDPNLSVYHYDGNAKYKYSWALQSRKADKYEDVVTVFTQKMVTK